VVKSLAVILAGLAGALVAAPGDTIWTRRYGGPSDTSDYAAAIVADVAGNVYVTGRSWDESGLMDDFATVKYNAPGDTVWTRRWDGNCLVSGYRNDQARAIAVDAPGNVYVTGSSFSNLGGDTNEDYMTIKYGPAGALLCSLRYTGPANLGSDIPYAMVVKNGYIYVTGQSYGDGTTKTDYATVKYATNGGFVWAERYDGGATNLNYDAARALAVDNGGNVYVTGFSRGPADGPYDYVTIKYDGSGTPLWTVRYNSPYNDRDEASAIALDPAGSCVYVTGYSCTTGGGGNADYLTIKYNAATGDTVWTRRYSGPLANGSDQATAVATDASGNVYVTGYSNGGSSGYDYATVKYDSAGVQQWAAVYNGPYGSGPDKAYAAAVDANGDILVTGESYGVTSQEDYATVKYDASGNQRWVARYDGPAHRRDRALALAIDNADHVYVTGFANNAGYNEDYLTIKYDDSPFHDVGVASIVAPAGAIDSGSAVVPACTLYNYGGYAEDYQVRMRIGSDYNHTASVSGHARAAKAYLTFAPWVARPRGSVAVSCSTELAGDARPSNDRRIDSVTVSVRDVGVARILSPTGTIDSGTPVSPACSVANSGTEAATYNVRMRIGSAYDNTVRVEGQPPGASIYLTFPAWIARPRGSSAVTCSTELSADQDPTNDKRVMSVIVNVNDVGPKAIVAPAGMTDSGISATPACTVANWGTTSADYRVRLKIGTTYDNIVLVSEHAPGMRMGVTFPTWTARSRGSNAVSCSTELGTDMVRANDRQTGSVDVAVHDVGAAAIVQPSGTIGPGPITPTATACNYGTAREACSVTFLIDCAPRYSATVNLTSGLPFTDTVLSFSPDWNAQPGSFTAKCSLYQANDQQAGNNVISQPFTVGAVDAGVLRILGPLGSYDTSDAIAPSARVKNYGDITVSFKAYFLIDNGADLVVYADSAPVSNLAGGDSALVDFAAWAKPHAVGSYTTRCSTYVAGDGDHGNDSQGGSFTITAPVPPPADTGWTQKADFPAGPKGKKVKDGACLAYLGPSDLSDLSDTSYVYALKGNNRCEFYQYNTDANTWAAKESIPPIGTSGKKKMVKKGASLAAGGGSLYATKGNNTVEFWEYRTLTDDYPWVQKADVPTGAKNVKEGTGAVSITSGETTYVYLLKGSGTQEFYRYNTLANTWQTMATAPAGLSGKPYKNGSCLAYDGSNVIYALKGSYDEFFAYHVDSNSWTTRTPLPLVGASGRKKKVKDGAGIAYLSGNWGLSQGFRPTKSGTVPEFPRSAGYLYAVKGGNTQEFWSYVADSDKWLQYPDVPLGSGKKVKGGGALVAGDDALYATKGNNTLEFYEYRPAAFNLQLAVNCNTMTRSLAPTLPYSLRVAPNPFSGTATIFYSLPQAGNMTLKLYDVAGALVTTLTSGYHNAGASSFILHRSSFARGIYLLKLETETRTTTSKLIIE
jgi:hypothetical protein